MNTQEAAERDNEVRVSFLPRVVDYPCIRYNGAMRQEAA